MELFINVVILGDSAAAVGTGVGQPGFEDFVNGFGRRRRPMRVLAMLFAGSAARFLGLRLRFAFGKRSRLPLPRAFEAVEPLFQLGDAALERVDDAIAFDAPRA